MRWTRSQLCRLPRWPLIWRWWRGIRLLLWVSVWGILRVTGISTRVTNSTIYDWSACAAGLSCAVPLFCWYLPLLLPLVIFFLSSLFLSIVPSFLLFPSNNKRGVRHVDEVVSETISSSSSLTYSLTVHTHPSTSPLLCHSRKKIPPYERVFIFLPVRC